MTISKRQFKRQLLQEQSRATTMANLIARGAKFKVSINEQMFLAIDKELAEEIKQTGYEFRLLTKVEKANLDATSVGRLDIRVGTYHALTNNKVFVLSQLLKFSPERLYSLIRNSSMVDEINAALFANELGLKGMPVRAPKL